MFLFATPSRPNAKAMRTLPVTSAALRVRYSCPPVRFVATDADNHDESVRWSQFVSRWMG